ncbi:hypothetical protein Bca4012_072251 [Brassica carinata]
MERLQSSFLFCSSKSFRQTPSLSYFILLLRFTISAIWTNVVAFKRQALLSLVLSSFRDRGTRWCWYI